MAKKRAKTPGRAVVVREEPKIPAVTAPVGSPAYLIQSIAAAAANPAVDVAKMKELYAMHADMKSKQAEIEFNDALAGVQSKINVVVATHINDHTKSKFAKLADVDRHVRPLYTAAGFSLSFGTGTPVRQDDIRITAKLSHKGGHSRDEFLDLPRDESGAQGSKNKTGVQGAGSTTTYGRRYLTCMIFNIPIDDDKDGNGGGGSSKALSDERVDELSKLIKGSKDATEIRMNYGKAFNEADDVGDKSAKTIFKNVKDARKKELGIE